MASKKPTTTTQPHRRFREYVPVTAVQPVTNAYAYPPLTTYVSPVTTAYPSRHDATPELQLPIEVIPHTMYPSVGRNASKYYLPGTVVYERYVPLVGTDYPPPTWTTRASKGRGKGAW